MYNPLAVNIVNVLRFAKICRSILTTLIKLRLEFAHLAMCGKIKACHVCDDAIMSDLNFLGRNDCGSLKSYSFISEDSTQIILMH